MTNKINIIIAIYIVNNLLINFNSFSQYIDLSKPLNNQQNLNITTVKFEWQSDIDSFLIEIDTSLNFTKPLVKIKTNYKTYSTNRLPYNTTFYWRVLCIQNNDTLAKSSVFSFKTMNSTGIYKKYLQHGIVKDSIGYFQSYDLQSIGAIEMKTQEFIWEYPFNDIYDVTPLIEQMKDGTWIIMNLPRYEQCLQARSLADGHLIWNSNNNINAFYGSGINLYTSADSNKYALASVGNGLHAISIEDGSELWHVPGDSTYYHAVPAVDQKNKLIYYQSKSTLKKIDAETGIVLDSVSTNRYSTHNNTLLVDDEYGYFIVTLWIPEYNSLNYGLLSIYDKDLNLIWEKTDVFTAELQSTTYFQGKLFVSQCPGYEYDIWKTRDESEYKKIRAFNISNGNVIWSSDLTKYSFTNILDYPYYDGYIYGITDNTGTDKDRIYFKINAENGIVEEVLYPRFQFSACATPVISNGLLAEGGHFVKFGEGVNNDWRFQYGNSCLNHNAIQNPTPSQSQPMHMVTPYHGKIKDTTVFFQEEGFKYQIPDLPTLYNLPYAIYYNSQGTNNAIYHYHFTHFYQVLENQSGIDTIYLAMTDPYFLDIIDTLVIKTIIVNDPPQKEYSFTDSLHEDSFYSINLNTLYKEIDNNQLNYSVIFSGNLLYTEIKDSLLILNPTQDTNGNDTLILNISNYKYSITDTFALFIKPINDPPYASKSGDTTIILQEDFGTKILDLNNYFGDIDSKIYYSLNENAKKINLEISENLLILSSINNKNGLESITISASDGEFTINQKIPIEISPVNDAPIFNNINEIILIEDFDTLTLDLQNYGKDIDTKILKFNIISYPELINIQLNDNQLTIISKPNFNGQDSIDLSVSDGEFTINQKIPIKIISVNDELSLKSNSPVSLSEDFGTKALDLNNYFGDIDSKINYSLNNNVEKINVEINNNLLILSSLNNINGLDSISISATDGEFTLNQILPIEISPVNDPPFFNSISEIILPEDFDTSTINVQNYANDIDTKILIYNLINYPEFVYTQLNDNELTITSKHNFNGQDSIELSVSDGEFTINKKVPIKIIPVNDPPGIKLNSYISLQEDFGTLVVDLNDYFEDPDSNDLKFKINNNNDHVYGTINQNNLIINSIENLYGPDSILISVYDGEFYVYQYILLNILPVNDLPRFYNMPDTILLKSTDIYSFFIDEFVYDVDTKMDNLRFDFIDYDQKIELNYYKSSRLLNINSKIDNAFLSTLKIIVHDSTNFIQKNITIRVLSDNIYTIVYPNPTISNATIQYCLPEDCDVHLSLYNLKGELLNYFVDPNKNNSLNEFVINLDKYKSNVYIYKIRAESKNKEKIYRAQSIIIKI